MRIIGGSLRGRDLGRVSEGVRPTSDRVREALFSSLGDVAGLRVLDLYAGTGALGLEAFSRGASGVVFVDQSRRVLRDLRRRLEHLGLSRVEALRLISSEASRALRRLASESISFDLVFVDPPYASGEREPVLEALFAGPLLSPDSVVVVEGPKRHPLAAIPGARRLEERRYGETWLTWLAPAGPESSGE
ncbi:MAG: 16S rRNA (guanine(966)-N(2))-methyltransferase RsmD [bacterium]